VSVRLKKVLIWSAGAVGAIILCIVLCISGIRIVTRSHRFLNADSVPAHRVGIVFGAKVRADGSLTPILQDRVDGAVTLYKKGKIKKIVMSGDNSTTKYDEVTAMQTYAVSHGVPKTDITLDYAGFSTYETCYRAHAIFGLSDAVLITQRYHMPRALYTCSHVGVVADGYAVADFSKYPDLRIPYMPREYGATLKAWLDVTILHPKPTYLGKSETIL